MKARYEISEADLNWGDASEMSDLARTIVAILADKTQTDANRIIPATRITELAIDSLSFVETLFALEEHFDITIPFNANRRADDEGDVDALTVAHLIGMVQQRLAPQAAYA